MCPSVENSDLVFQESVDPQGLTHTRPAGFGSRQAIQARPHHPVWSLLPEVFQLISNRWHQPQIDLLATRFNNKLPQFVSPVPNSLAWAVDALSPPWEDLDPHAFPPVAILGQVMAKLRDYPCRRIILIAPGWPNMPWFWDLVAMSGKIPLCSPKLLTQPFNQITHKNLSNLNLHTWLLVSAIKEQGFSEAVAAQIEAPQKGSTRSVYEAKRISFTKKGATVIRRTSGYHLSSH